MILYAMMLQAAAAPASDDVAGLSRRVAATGGLVRILPMVAAKEADDLVKDHPELTAAEQAEVRATAQTVMTAGRERILAASAPTYAAALTPAQMREILAFEESAAAKARAAAELPAVLAAAKTLDGFDFKGEVMTAFCKKTGKDCPTKK